MKLYLVINFAILFISCNPEKKNLSQEEKNNISQEIRQTLNNYYTDIQNEGLLAEMKYLDSSEDFFWVPPGYTESISFDSVSSILKQNAPLYQSISNSWVSLHIIPISANLASYTGKIHSKISVSADKNFEVDLIETGTMIRWDGKWKLLCGQTATIDKK